jgi:hypothetical protein
MKNKIKLTELTREELRQVTGGVGGVGASCKCACTGNVQTFGQSDSVARGGTASPMPRAPKPSN